MINETAEAASRAASHLTYGGAGVALGSVGACTFGLTGDEWTVLFGAIGAGVAVAGYFLNRRYKRIHADLLRQLIAQGHAPDKAVAITAEV